MSITGLQAEQRRDLLETSKKKCWLQNLLWEIWLSWQLLRQAGRPSDGRAQWQEFVFWLTCRLHCHSGSCTARTTWRGTPGSRSWCLAGAWAGVVRTGTWSPDLPDRLGTCNLLLELQSVRKNYFGLQNMSSFWSWLSGAVCITIHSNVTWNIFSALVWVRAVWRPVSRHSVSALISSLTTDTLRYSQYTHHRPPSALTANQSQPTSGAGDQWEGRTGGHNTTVRIFPAPTQTK